jgi:hypothetical protein
MEKEDDRNEVNSPENSESGINPNQETENPRVVLKNLWKDVKNEVVSIQGGIGSLNEEMTKISDAADIGMKAADHGNEYGDWESAISSLERQKIVLYGLHTKLDETINDFKAVSDTSTGSAIYSSFNLVSPDSYGLGPDVNFEIPTIIFPNVPPYDPYAPKIWCSYIDFFNRSDLKNQVLDLMKNCGFKKRKVGQQAIERFENAWGLFEMPSPVDDPAIGSLISLRAAIKLTIDTLRQLKLYQTDRKDEIRDIGDQLAAPGVTKDYFDELEKDLNGVGGLNDSLSGSKDNASGRDHEITMMNKGSLFLYRLLSALDTRLLNLNKKGKKAERRRREQGH